MSNTIEIVINAEGTIAGVWHDDLVGLRDQGEARIVRASHVEPDAPGGRWTADMTPSGGPVLFGPDGNGFSTRQEALDAERAWLKEYRGL